MVLNNESVLINENHKLVSILIDDRYTATIDRELFTCIATVEILDGIDTCKTATFEGIDCEKAAREYIADFKKSIEPVKTKYTGYGYHGGGRPRKAEGQGRKTMNISGTAEQIANIKSIASGAGYTVSGLVWYLLERFENGNI